MFLNNLFIFLLINKLKTNTKNDKIPAKTPKETFKLYRLNAWFINTKNIILKTIKAYCKILFLLFFNI